MAGDTSMDRFCIRLAKREDCQEIFKLVQEFTAEFNQPPSRLSPQELQVDGFDSEIPNFKCLVIENRETVTGGNPGVLKGYAMFYPMYSAREGKALWLEDIFVSEECRGLGLGKILFQRVAQEAHANDVRRIDFSVYSWNPATKFYSRMGAVNISDTEEWKLWRLNHQAIIDFATKK